jgi:hypothetical protein
VCVVFCGVIEAIMNLLRCLEFFPYLLTSLIFVLAALSQKVQGSGESRTWYMVAVCLWIVGSHPIG